MNIAQIFTSYKQRRNRVVIMRALIDGMMLDNNQKYLYKESIENLDDDHLNGFYNKLTEFITDREMIKIQHSGKYLEQNEQTERAKETKNIDFFLTTI